MTDVRGHLLLGGRSVLVPFEVRHREKWHFRGARRKRTKPLRFGVLHHQGGEGSAGTLWRVLKKRGYSVHFGIDRQGVITQYVDPLEWVTYHAGEANDYSWGVEIANRGLAPTSKRFPRESYEDRMHGRKVTFLRFYEPQVWSAYNLCRAMEKFAGTPIRLPLVPGTNTVVRGVYDDWKSWRGLLCHYHLVRRKVDPSPHLADDLARIPDAYRDWTELEDVPE